MQYVNIEQTYTVFCLFGGAGGGALGAQMAQADYRGLRGRAVILGSVDSDPDACADFEMWTGVPATQMDLFDREQYRDWWGTEPPADWHEAAPEEIRAAAQGQDPDVVLITAPCKGFSGLLSEAKSSSKRYQALNRLTFRGVFLTLEAWRHSLPAFILFENVPRIATRGRRFLREIKGLLAAYGYVFHESHHDCGELGGLAQHRRRYLLVARHPAKVSSYLYNPPKQRVRSIGSGLGEMPMPGDPIAGPLHRLPQLQWKTWVRLALIPPGGDWRDLQNVEGGEYLIQPYMEDGVTHPNKYRVCKWDEVAPTVTGSRMGSGAPAVAQPLGHTPMGNGKGAFWVQDWGRPSGTITADPSHRKSGGASVVADPRIGHEPRQGSMQVGAWDQPSGPVVGSAAVTSSNGIGAVADPRLSNHGANYAGSPGLMGVNAWDQPSPTVTGSASVSGSNTPAAVADPRYHREPRAGVYDVAAWEQPSKTVTTGKDSNGNRLHVADPRGEFHTGAVAVADPRIPADDERGAWVIVSPWGFWHRPLTTLELLALQGFPWRHADGSAIELAGRSDRAWRERIGNAVPPPTMAAIMGQMIYSLLASETQDWRMDMLQTGVWVRPEETDTAV